MPLIAAADVPAALGLLTRLPVRVDVTRATARGAGAAWAWPLAGVVVAALAALAAWGALRLGVPVAAAAAVVLAVQVAVTGAMHEDGLADSLDGLWGGADRARRLAIMKDSRIGSYGVLVLVISLLLRFSAVAALLAVPGWAAALVAVAALSRAGMAALAGALPFARPGGLSASVGRPQSATVALGLALALLLAGILTGAAVLVLAPVMALALAGWGLIARARIGGQTGDILGAGQQVTEIAGLLALAALA
ncbi:MAG: adenosylcobinamide-GDP ribazoletransferase [Rubellimicrobium sp.]|nr:adenosylcobinamide-GDP ribazoletransferase [Rubellimicrobium sp.]